MTEFVLHPQLNKDSFWISDLPLCAVHLINDANYPWLILVPKISNITEVIQFSEAQQQTLWQESAMVSQVITQLFTPDKLNMAALGNMVPQLHLHHIARYKNDISWPKPIWGLAPAKPYSDDVLAERLTLLKQAIEQRDPK